MNVEEAMQGNGRVSKRRGVRELLGVVFQIGMACSLIYIAYMLMLRPMVLGVDIVPRTLVKCSGIYAIYALFNALYKLVVCFEIPDKRVLGLSYLLDGVNFVEEDGMHLTSTSLLVVVLNSLFALVVLWIHPLMFNYMVYLGCVVLGVVLHIFLLYAKRVSNACNKI